ncbi:MAG: GNAT family N-acetyltransferase [Victivallales bacterium]|nr:GNAT family N-acetyltransferase [Victivallales bacterium]
MTIEFRFEPNTIDWNELAELYRVAPLGTRRPAALETVYANSRYKCFAYDGNRLIGAGRALADGADCSYLCDIALHPDYQGRGLGRQLVQHLIRLSAGHKKIILYANPGREGFYTKLGFRPMNTAMAIFQDEADAVAKGIIS